MGKIWSGIIGTRHEVFHPTCRWKNPWTPLGKTMLYFKNEHVKGKLNKAFLHFCQIFWHIWWFINVSQCLVLWKIIKYAKNLPLPMKNALFNLTKTYFLADSGYPKFRFQVIGRSLTNNIYPSIVLLFRVNISILFFYLCIILCSILFLKKKKRKIICQKVVVAGGGYLVN